MRLNPAKSVFLWTAVLTLALSLSACQTTPPASKTQSTPNMKILSPATGTVIAGPKIKIEVEVSTWTLVDANQAIKDGEGHLHFFVDTPANAIKVGEGIPLDQKATFIHAGKAPYTIRDLDLAPGEHTVTVVMGNSAHQVLAAPAPVSVTFKVQ